MFSDVECRVLNFQLKLFVFVKSNTSSFQLFTKIKNSYVFFNNNLKSQM